MLEGGGQILRNASALSAITGQVVEVSKIRAARAKPGLAAQHLTGLTLVNTLSNGRMQGAWQHQRGYLLCVGHVVLCCLWLVTTCGLLESTPSAQRALNASYTMAVSRRPVRPSRPHAMP